ncbi:TonB-dependent hemoglobin/transferrin/lactoferrin family receptor [Curvivirga sp.]|uniref:TonB-dependent hemoglobin/transferrin/lactoferrin family receptor n=1 Tax=Curvivirga sp. TaxID=2856848 RepID=UPI003B58C4B4
MQKKLHLAFATGLLYSTSLTGAYAQDSSPVTTTEEVTVYATRSEETTFSVPAIVDTVDVDAVENANANDLEDLLGYVPGVEILNGPRRSSQTISIRGFDDEQLLILMDGRRQNVASGHDGRLFVDPSLLKSVEVVKGSSSSIYGSGAVGGVVAFETKDASDLLKPDQELGAQVSAGYASASRDKTTTATGYGRIDGFDIVGSVSYRDAGSIEQGNDTKLYTEDEIASGLFKAGYTFNDFHTLKANIQSYVHDGLEPSNSDSIASSTGLDVDKEITDRQFGLQYEYENPENDLVNLKAHVYFNDNEIKETDISGSDAGRVQIRETDTIGFNLDNQSFLTFSGQNHTLAYGLEYYEDEQTPSSTESDGYDGVPHAEAENFGLYLQDTIETAIGTEGKFTITPALRYDSYESSDDSGRSQDESAFSPKLAIAVEPTSNYIAFASLSSAFRAPSISELYATGVHFTAGPFVTNRFIPNEELKPEKVTTFEVGAGFNFDNVLASADKITVKGSYFKSRGKDFIDQDVQTTTTQSVNIDRASIQGWEVQLDYKVDNITTYASLNTTKARDESDNTYLNASVPLTMIAGLTYDVASIDSSFGFRVKAAEANNRIKPSTSSSALTATDGYGVLDIYYRWVPEFAEESLTVDLGVNNITDKAYTPNFSNLYEEGRSVVGKVTYKW